MSKLNYNQFIELINKYEKFDAKTLKAMYEEFGKNKINGYFEEYCQSLEMDKVGEFIKKYSAYFEQQNVDLDNNDLLDGEIGNIVGMLVNSAAQYSLMTAEFERQQGYILEETKKELTIIRNIDDESILYPTLEIEKILVSVKSKEDLDNIDMIRKLPYKLGDESILKNDINTIKKFLKLNANNICTIEQLKSEFPELKFDNIIPIDDLSKQLNLLNKYIFAKFNFYNRNLRLVISVAKKNTSILMPMEDKIQEGNIGLIRAINRYSASTGYKFSTYAIWWIRQSIHRAIAIKSEIIRKPVYLFDNIRKYNTFIQKYNALNGCDPSIAECCLELGMKENEIRAVQCAASDLISLNTPIQGISNDSEEIINFIFDKTISVEDNYISKDFFDCVLNEIDIICNEREKDILLNRLGLNDENVIYTLQEIADRLGVTRERVRQIEAKSKRRLIFNLKRKGLVDNNYYK